MRAWPKSLRGRLTLTLILGLIGIMIVAGVLASAVLYDSARGRWAQPIAERLALTVNLLESADDDDRGAVARALGANGIAVERAEGMPHWMNQGGHGFAPIAERVRALLPEQTRIALAPHSGRPGGLVAYVETDDLPPIIIRFRELPPDPRFLISLAVMIAAAALGIVVLATWAARRVTRPLTQFAAAADRLGGDQLSEPLAERGPTEIATAAHALNRMQDRIRRFVSDRMHLIAAAGHDLRTPITRLRLRAEFVDDPDLQAKLLRDLDEMERLIDDTIALVREETDAEPSVALDLGALVAGLVEDRADMTPAPHLAEAEQGLMVHAGPMALRRALGNLIDNALRHGGAARISLARAAGRAAPAAGPTAKGAVTDGRATDVALAELIIVDSGPGIPQDALERVFDPFVRVEASRSRDTGGSGLGLAIARTIIQAQGGTIRLDNRPEGGLRQTVRLPLASPETTG